MQLYNMLQWSMNGVSQVYARVRTILLLGYWVLGNICRYWIILLVLGDIFCCSDTQYNTNQRAVGTIHIPVNDYLVPLVTCTLTATVICLDTMLIYYCFKNTIIIIIIKLWDFTWYSAVYISLQTNTLLCYTVVSVLGIGIARGQHYWILGALLDIVLTLVYALEKTPRHHSVNRFHSTCTAGTSFAWPIFQIPQAGVPN